MDYLASAYTASEQPQHHCPIMTLPTEMRIRIYDYALQHFLDAIYNEAPSVNKLWRPVTKPRAGMPFYTGALAFTHTNRIIRAESLDVLASRMLAHVDRLEDEVHDIASNALLRVKDPRGFGYDIDGLQVIAREVTKLGNTAVQVKWICYTMAWTKGG